MSCFSFSQPVASFGNCLGAVAVQASNAFSSLTSKSVSEHTTNIITKTSQAARSIPDYITYSPEGAKYMRYANTLIPGVLFVGSGINFAVYAHKTDSRSQKIAAYLLAAASIVYGGIQIVIYLSTSNCIGKEIQSKKFEYDKKLRNRPSILSDSFTVKYNSNTGQPEYCYLENIMYSSLEEVYPGIQCSTKYEVDAYTKSQCF